MIETKEGTPIPNSNIPEAIKRPVAKTIVTMPLIHPLDLYFQKSPAQVKAELAQLEKTAYMIKNHWTFVFVGLALTALNYYRNYQTGKTLKEIRGYIRAKKT